MTGEKLLRRERLRLIKAKLDQAPPCSCAEEAEELLKKVITEVEDKHSWIPKSPLLEAPLDGRIYPPLLKKNKRGAHGDKVATTAGHRVYVYADGAIEFFLRGDTIEFDVFDYRKEGCGQR